MVKSIAVFTFLFWSLHSNAQMDSFSILRDKMFFNILAHKADSQVYDFVEKYFPDFNRPPVTGGWTAYPPGPLPVYQSTMHSFIFKRHPHYDSKFREGRLDFVSKETKDGRTVAYYGPYKDSVEGVEFILVADDFHTGKYKLLFRLGALTYYK